MEVDLADGIDKDNYDNDPRMVCPGGNMLGSCPQCRTYFGSD